MNGNNKNEMHLFLIWNNAYYRLNQIIEDISNNFNILRKVEIKWSKVKFSENLTQFYGTKLSDNSFKEKHCGNGPFTVVIVDDYKPHYGPRMTSKGKMNVNMKMFDLKMKYRSITGGGHKIHATNYISETRHDLILLLGKTLEEIQNSLDEEKGSRSITRDIEGANGWNNLSHLFKILNNTTKYVILRNFESFDDNKLDDDIDILTSSPKELQFIIKAKKVHKNKRRSAYLIKINNQDVFIDIRYLNDGYYDENWQLDMLKKRCLSNNGYYILDLKDYFYSLLYHSIIHKPYFSSLYEKRLKNMLESSKLNSINIEQNNWASILSEFLNKNKYIVRIPKDYSVFFNYQHSFYYKKDYNAQIIRKIRSILIKIKKRVNEYS